MTELQMLAYLKLQLAFHEAKVRELTAIVAALHINTSDLRNAEARNGQSSIT